MLRNHPAPVPEDVYKRQDQSYSEYEKVAAQVISKDPGNWYDTFVINKGSNDGIQKDMNVIADGGLVGLVEEVSSNSATVRSIIDDSSSVSAMTAVSYTHLSIELSADGPIKPPYAVYFQGGLTWQHAKFGILMSLQKLVDAGMVTL